MVLINLTELLMIPACLSLVCFLTRAVLKGLTLQKSCLMFLERYVLFDMCIIGMDTVVPVGTRFLDLNRKKKKESLFFIFFLRSFSCVVCLKCLKPFVKIRKKYFHECCPLVQHDFRFCCQSFVINYESLWAGSIHFHKENSWKTWLFRS